MYSFCFSLFNDLVSLSSQFGAQGVLTILLAVMLVSFEKVMILPLSLTSCCGTRIEARAQDQDGDNVGAIDGLKNWLLQNHVVVK